MTRQGSLADRDPARGCLDATHQRGASSSTPCGLVDFGESKHFRAREDPGGLGQSLDLYTRTLESESLPSRLTLSLLVPYRDLV